MTHFVDIIAYSFLVVALCATVLQRLKGDMDFVSFGIGGGLQAIHNDRVHPSNDSEGVAQARLTLETLNYLSNPNFNFDINKVDVDNLPNDPFLNVRVYNYNTTLASPLRGVLVWYHGGGWVQGNIAGDDTMCIRMASLTSFVVVSVNYRMAPEFPYPVPLEDSIHALNWVVQNIHKYGGDSSSVFVGGESAGGNLAAAIVAHRETQSLHGKPNSGTVQGLLMVYPPLDNKETLSSYSSITHSLGLLSTPQMAWFRLLYSGNNQTLLQDDAEYLFAPLHTPSEVLSRFPPSVMVLADNDVLRDDGVQFAQRLREVGVKQVYIDLYNGTIHGFFGRRIFPQGFRAMDSAMDKLLSIHASVIATGENSRE